MSISCGAGANLYVRERPGALRMRLPGFQKPAKCSNSNLALS